MRSFIAFNTKRLQDLIVTIPSLKTYFLDLLYYLVCLFARLVTYFHLFFQITSRSFAS